MARITITNKSKMVTVPIVNRTLNMLRQELAQKEDSHIDWETRTNHTLDLRRENRE